jgi:hypothetical protein
MGSRPGLDISKHKGAKAPKAKPKSNKTSKKMIRKPWKENQSRLPFEPLRFEAPPSTPPRAPRAGGRVEEASPQNDSFISVVVESPSRFNREMYHNASPVQFKDLGMYVWYR